MSWVFFFNDTLSSQFTSTCWWHHSPWWHHKSETSSARFDSSLPVTARCSCVFHVTKVDFYVSLDAPRRSDASSTYGAAILEDTYVAVAEKHACCQSNTRRAEGWVRVCFLSHLSVNEPRRGKETVVSVSRWRRLSAPSSDCQAGRPHRLQTNRRRFLLITEPTVNLSFSLDFCRNNMQYAES